MSTLSRRERLPCQAGLATNPGDYPDALFLDITLPDSRMMRGREGLLPVSQLLLCLCLCLCLRRRRRPRHRLWWWPSQKRLWSKSLKRNAGRSRERLLRPRHAPARNRNHCEGNAHVQKYRSRSNQSVFFSFFFYFGLFSFSFIFAIIASFLL